MSIVSAADLLAQIERAISLSQRPSQYAGCEAGTSRALAKPGVKKIALCWGAFYDKAMSDSMLIALYQELASWDDLVVERFFLMGEDLQGHLKNSGLADVWFSLESKRLISEFDFVVSRGLALDARLASFRESGAIVEISDQPKETAGDLVARVRKELGLNLPPTPDAWSRLIALRSHEDYRLTDECLKPAKSFVEGRAHRVRLRLARGAWARFISHLEQIQVFKSATLLAGWPLAATLGRHIRLKMGFGPAISVGWESQAEYADIVLGEPLDMTAAMVAVNRYLPRGYEALSLVRIPWHFPSLEESANVSEYWIESKNLSESPDWEKLMRWLERVRTRQEGPVIVRKEKPGEKVDLIDVSDVIVACSIGSSPLKDSNTSYGLRLTLRFGPKKNLKPEKILELGLGWPMSRVVTDVRICRLQLALELPSGKLRAL